MERYNLVRSWREKRPAIEPQIRDVANIGYAARRSDETAEAAWQHRMALRRESIQQGIERLQGAIAYIKGGRAQGRVAITV